MQQTLIELVELIHLTKRVLEEKEGIVSKEALLFLSFTDNKEEHAFLEKVVKATSDRIAPASLLSVTPTTDWSSLVQSAKLLIAPLSDLQKIPLFKEKLDGKKVHECTENFFLLADLDNYLHDIESKRALWNQLLALPQ